MSIAFREPLVQISMENHHEEIWVHIIQELLANIHIYRDTQHLRFGQYQMMKQNCFFLPLLQCLRWTKCWRDKKEILGITKPEIYRELWQIFASSFPFFSIYLELGNPLVCSHIHWLIQPRMPRLDSDIPVYTSDSSFNSSLEVVLTTLLNFLPSCAESSLMEKEKQKEGKESE